MRKSREIIQLVQKIRKSKKMSMDELVNKIGISKSTLSRYETGKREFPVNDLGKYASALNVSVEYLLGVGETKNMYYSYPYYPANVAAGLPENVSGITDKDIEHIDIPDTIMGRWAGNKNIFITRINGDSMNKKMPDKSLIAVKPISLSELNNGDMVVFSKDNEYGVKYYRKQGDKLIFKPHSTNEEHHDQEYSVDDNVTIHGKVVIYIVEQD